MFNVSRVIDVQVYSVQICLLIVPVSAYFALKSLQNTDKHHLLLKAKKGKLK